MKHCEEIRNQEYVLGTLPEERIAEEKAHLEVCTRCAREVESYRLLFDRLADLPEPPVPEGIPEAVLARLQPDRLRDRRRLWVDRPVIAALAGGVAGIALALFREPLALLLGRMAGGLLVDGAAELLRGVRAGIDQYIEWTVLLELLVSWVLKLEPLIRALGEAMSTLAGQASLLMIGLTLATALLLGRLVGQFKKEGLGHARR